MLCLFRCSRLGVSALAYLWRRDQRQLYEEMIANGLVAVIIKVAVMGKIISSYFVIEGKL